MSEEQKRGGQAPAGNGNPEEGEGLTPDELNQDVQFEKDELDYVGEDTSKKIQTAVAQKKHWRDKHDKVFAELESYKKAHPETPAPPAPPQKKKEADKDDELNHRIAVLELQRDNPDLKLTREAADMAIAFSKTRGTTPQEVISSTFFQTFLKEEDDKKKAAGGTPAPSHRAGQPAEDWEKYVRDPALIKTLSKEKYTELQAWIKANPDKVPKE